jgi:hypothetical protein
MERVAFAIPRVAAHVPWRADCFVQALAAQAWLRRFSVPSEILIGARQDPRYGLEAHAWLRSADIIVVGGDIRSYARFVTPGRLRDQE